MTKHTIHTILSTLTLCVMTLTSTGFTTIVGYCTMTKSAECCCEQTHEASIPSSGSLAFSDPDASCYHQTLAGGKIDITATLQSAASQDISVSDALPIDPVAVPLPLVIHFSRLLATNDVAPPGVDIRIRVSSFLI